MEQHETWNFFDLRLNIVCEQALVLIEGYVKLSIILPIKKGMQPIQ